MAEKTTAYLITEGRGPETTPTILKSNKEVCSFRVGVLQEADIVNRNGRRYGWDLLNEACNHSYIRERLKTGTLYSEAGHPTEQSVERQMRIDRNNISCIIKELHFNKPHIGGIVETAATRVGKDFRGLIVENGCKVAFSMRGLGKVKKNNGIIDVKSPLRIITWDDVVHPSVEKAYMNEIISEAVTTTAAERNDEESFTLLAEDTFARYIFDLSPDAKESADAMEFDVNDPTARIVVNENGTLSVSQGGEKLICLTEGFIRKEVRSQLANL